MLSAACRIKLKRSQRSILIAKLKIIIVTSAVIKTARSEIHARLGAKHARSVVSQTTFLKFSGPAFNSGKKYTIQEKKATTSN